jgi:hypothetical protein
MRMRKYYPVAALLILLVAIALSASLVTTNANALPTFTDPVGGIGPCVTCHTQTTVHAVVAHNPLVCTNCHLTDTATPPLPKACGACHGGVSVILTSATHVTTKCGATVGCHGVVSTPTATPTTTPTTTPTATPTATPTPKVTPKVTLKLSGLTSGAMKLGRSVTAKGKVTPTSLAGSKVKLTVQKKRGARWVTVKSVARTISASGAYSWKYKPVTRGAYHMRATIAKTAAHTAARTKWRSFRVVKRIAVPNYNG